MKGQLKVVAMTATDLPPYRKIDGCTIVNREEIQYLEYDMLIVMNEKNFKEIVQEAVMVYHIPREKIISYKILQIPLCDLQFYKYSIDIHSQKKYPVFLCDDIKIHCNHESNIEEAVEKWNRRKEKINWKNLFVEMYTEDPEIEQKFVALEDYKNKVCFVPYPSKQENSFSLSLMNGQKEFWETVNGNATDGKNSFAYDLVELLLNMECKRSE